MTIQDFFLLGMKRSVGSLLPMVKRGVILNVGGGRHSIDGAVDIDFPEIDLEDISSLRKWYADNTVSGIHCYHVLEHLKNPINALKEFQRILKPGGVLNIVVPHYSCQMAFQDLDHKSFYTLDTWKELFENPFYDKNSFGWKWKLKVNINFLMGVSDRNIAIFTQMIKE